MSLRYWKNGINPNNMKKILFSLALFPILACAQQKTFTINGNVSGIADSEVKIANLQGDQVLATAKAANGVFTLKGSVNEPGLYMLHVGGDQPQYIFLENAQIKVSGSKANLASIKVDGSASHQEFMKFQQVFNPIFGELTNLSNQIQQAEGDKRNQLIGQYQDVVKKLNAEVYNFVSANKKSYVSPFLLFNTAQVAESPTELERRYMLLDESIRNSETGKNLGNYINYMKVGSIGSKAMDFTQADPDGKPVSLSSFQGKYVLVDFWASWCRPCRVENPNVVKAFNKFKDKNFTVLGVSLDSNKEAWLKAIEADNLKWPHVSDLKQWNNEVAVMYHVTSIPQNFLVGPDGTIVAKDLRGEDLEKKLCELLGCN